MRRPYPLPSKYAFKFTSGDSPRKWVLVRFWVVLLLVPCLALSEVEGLAVPFYPLSLAWERVKDGGGIFAEQALADVPIASQQLPGNPLEVELRNQESVEGEYKPPAPQDHMNLQPVYVASLKRDFLISPATFNPDNDWSEIFQLFIQENAALFENARGLDLGTGSGVLAVALARAGATVIATDILEETVEIAKRNVSQERPEVARRVTVRQSDIYNGLADLVEPKEGGADFLVFQNPLYAEEADPRDPKTYGASAGRDFQVNRRAIAGLPRILNSHGVAYMWAMRPKAGVHLDGGFWTEEHLKASLPEGWIAEAAELSSELQVLCKGSDWDVIIYKLHRSPAAATAATAAPNVNEDIRRLQKDWSEVREAGLALSHLEDAQPADEHMARNNVVECEASRWNSIYLMRGGFVGMTGPRIAFEFPQPFPQLQNLDMPAPGVMYGRSFSTRVIWRSIDLARFPPSRIIVAEAEIEPIHQRLVEAGFHVPILAMEGFRAEPEAYYHSRPLNTLEGVIRHHALLSEGETQRLQSAAPDRKEGSALGMDPGLGDGVLWITRGLDFPDGLAVLIMGIAEALFYGLFLVSWGNDSIQSWLLLNYDAFMPLWSLIVVRSVLSWLIFFFLRHRRQVYYWDRYSTVEYSFRRLTYDAPEHHLNKRSATPVDRKALAKAGLGFRLIYLGAFLIFPVWWIPVMIEGVFHAVRNWNTKSSLAMDAGSGGEGLTNAPHPGQGSPPNASEHDVPPWPEKKPDLRSKSMDQGLTARFNRIRKSLVKLRSAGAYEEFYRSLKTLSEDVGAIRESLEGTRDSYVPSWGPVRQWSSGNWIHFGNNILWQLSAGLLVRAGWVAELRLDGTLHTVPLRAYSSASYKNRKALLVDIDASPGFIYSRSGEGMNSGAYVYLDREAVAKQSEVMWRNYQQAVQAGTDDWIHRIEARLTPLSLAEVVALRERFLMAEEWTHFKGSQVLLKLITRKPPPETDEILQAILNPAREPNEILDIVESQILEDVNNGHIPHWHLAVGVVTEVAASMEHFFNSPSIASQQMALIEYLKMASPKIKKQHGLAAKAMLRSLGIIACGLTSPAAIDPVWDERQWFEHLVVKANPLALWNKLLIARQILWPTTMRTNTIARSDEAA